MNFEIARRVADAVLYEGYVLYPYRASSLKNRLRWQFGVIAPRAPHDDGEPSFAQTECLVVSHQSSVSSLQSSVSSLQSSVSSLQSSVSSHQSSVSSRGPTLNVRFRCLRPMRRDDQWLDAVRHEVDVRAGEDVSLEALGIRARIAAQSESCGTFVKLRVRIENLEPWRDAFDADRDRMLERSMVGAHLLLAVEDGVFVSLVEPPPEAESAAAACRNINTWPVLVGDRGACDVMLSSPIVLYDFPAVAKESAGDLCDAAEIDEILSLRILTMTDEEKAEARATDPRAREILDRVEGMNADSMAALHGTMRSADFFNPPGTPSPDEAFTTIGDCRVSRGSHIRLRPNRRADSMDMFLAGQPATVAGVYRDVDDRVYVAVTVDADPAASLHESFGRYFYFDPTEIDPITPDLKVWPAGGIAKDTQEPV